MQRNRYPVRLLLVFCAFCAVSCSPAGRDEPEEGLITEAKRDATSGAAATSPLLKSPLFNPYLYPPLIPGKPYFYPFLTPTDVLLNRFAKSAPGDLKTSSAPASLQTPKSYFKTKKDEFLMKLFEKISNASESPEVSTRSVSAASEDPDEPTKPTIDPAFFVNKKMDFLEKLFQALNSTPMPAPASATGDAQDAGTTPKPTIVPANFWFPFLKPAKPTKAPKPTKPPKAKKVLKDALEAMMLQSILSDLGIDPNSETVSKRSSALAPEKKMKSKKAKSEEGADFRIPAKVDPSLYSTKASDCLDKLFKMLGKADEEDAANFVEPKATVVPYNLWTRPSETEYTSKLDAFLDLLLKSLNATEGSKTATAKLSKTKKPDFSSRKLEKRATFMDELLHRIPPTTSTTAQPDSSDCDCSVRTCCCGKSCADAEAKADAKEARSLIFKPFGTGYWIPQYLYAAKMGMYLDKLMDTINAAAVEDASAESSTSMKRSLTPGEGKINVTGLSARESALSLLISQLVDVKNEIVDAFGDGVKAQKDASASKPFSSGAKSFKKPYWGPKPSPTTDPVEPIQKRIDILNEIFDKLTEVEKALIFPDNSDDSALLKGPKDDLSAGPNVGNVKMAPFKTGKTKFVENAPQESFDSQSPESYIEKTRGFLQALYANKVNSLNEEDDNI